MSFNIGKFTIAGGVLAPMAGYTDIAFRELCVSYGAGLTVTEMVSVRGLVHGNAATDILMRTAANERPSCVQLFGSAPDDFARAATVVKSDIIDVNMGCPMPKIVKNGDGGALMRSPENAGAIVRALKNATDKPITVKTRLGYEIGAPRLVELADSVIDAGAAAIAVHGRYAEQRYAGNADYSEIVKLAEKSKIPVIVNGDIKSVETVQPFAGVMIGRAALANPAVFSGGTADPFEVARRHMELSQKYFDDRYTVNQARKFFVHYFKGMCGGKTLRDEVNRATRVEEVLRALDRAQKAALTDRKTNNPM